MHLCNECVKLIKSRLNYNRWKAIDLFKTVLNEKIPVNHENYLVEYMPSFYIEKD